MGDGEIAGTAIEVPLSAPLSGQRHQRPEDRLAPFRNEDAIMTVGGPARGRRAANASPNSSDGSTVIDGLSDMDAY